MAQPAHARLHHQLWARQHAALDKVQAASVAAAAAKRRAIADNPLDLQAKPDFVLGSPLYPHQLQVSLESPAKRVFCLSNVTSMTETRFQARKSSILTTTDFVGLTA